MLKSSFKQPVRGNTSSTFAKQLTKQPSSREDRDEADDEDEEAESGSAASANKKIAGNRFALEGVSTCVSNGVFDDGATGHSLGGISTKQQQHQQKQQHPRDNDDELVDDDDDHDDQQQQHEENTRLLNQFSGTVNNVVVESRDVSERWGVGQRSMRDDEFSIFSIINTLRTHPKSLIPIFESALKRYDADSGSIAPVPDTSDDPVICEEGPKCIHEAIDFLKKVRPLSVLLDAPMGLLLAARDFVMTAQKRLDNVAEEETTAVTDARLARYGKVEGKKMQLVALGSHTPESIILQLILGDGNPSRPERDALFNPEIRCCAAAIIDHPVYRHVAFIHLAAGYQDNPHNEQKTAHKLLWSDL